MRDVLMGVGRRERVGPPSFGAVAACAALLALACGGDTGSADAGTADVAAIAPDTVDTASDLGSDVNRVDADASEDPATDPDVAPLADAATDTTDPDVQDVDDAMDASNDAAWKPDGDWVLEHCAPGTLPEPSGFAQVPLASEDLIVGPAGACVCQAGICIDIPAGALSAAADFGVFLASFTPWPYLADSQHFFVSVRPPDHVGLQGSWDTVNSEVPWRVAIRTFAYVSEAGVDSGSEAFFRPDGLDALPEPAGGGWVTEDVWAFDWTPPVITDDDWYSFSFFLGHIENYCGDGVVGPHEECDPPRTGDCNACFLSRYSTCEGSPQVCRDFCEGVECPAAETCAEYRCDIRIDRCIRYPRNEGQLCEVDGETGWCDAGDCVTIAEECAPCGPQMRWVGGRCVAEEPAAKWIAGLDPSAPTAYLTFDGGIPQVMASWGLTWATDFGFVDESVDLPTGWLQVTYRTRPWVDLLSGLPEDVSVSFEEIPVPVSEEWTTTRIPVADFVRPAGWYVSGATDGVDEGDEDGFLAVRSVVVSENGFDPCSIGVDVDGEWELCPLTLGRQACGDACVDTRSNVYHCGTCGNRCAESQVCEQGECRVEPALRQFAPDWTDGCPDGYWGADCASPCPGLLETGTACGGNGTCSDGPFGRGTCRCSGGHHGLECQFSCNDGVRNGRERHLDCGGVCRGCVAYFSCLSGTADCNGAQGDGCEASLDRAETCGACDVQCAEGQECIDGACETP